MILASTLDPGLLVLMLTPMTKLILSLLLVSACAADVGSPPPEVYDVTWLGSTCVAPTCPAELRATRLTVVDSQTIEWTIDEIGVADAAFLQEETLVLPAESDPVSFQLREQALLAPTDEGWRGLVTWQPDLPISATLVIGR